MICSTLCEMVGMNTPEMEFCLPRLYHKYEKLSSHVRTLDTRRIPGKDKRWDQVKEQGDG